MPTAGMVTVAGAALTARAGYALNSTAYRYDLGSTPVACAINSRQLEPVYAGRQHNRLDRVIKNPTHCAVNEFAVQFKNQCQIAGTRALIHCLSVYIDSRGSDRACICRNSWCDLEQRDLRVLAVNM